MCQCVSKSEQIQFKTWINKSWIENILYTEYICKSWTIQWKQLLTYFMICKEVNIYDLRYCKIKKKQEMCQNYTPRY